MPGAQAAYTRFKRLSHRNGKAGTAYIYAAFSLYFGEQKIGEIKREFKFFSPSYYIDFNGRHIDGNFMGWDYTIADSNGMAVAKIGKEPFNFTDTYVIDVANGVNALYALMIALAIDAEKCSSF